jgi:hypothetical protein
LTDSSRTNEAPNIPIPAGFKIPCGWRRERESIAGQLHDEYIPIDGLNQSLSAYCNGVAKHPHRWFYQRNKFMKTKLTLWAALIGVALLTGCATKPNWDRPAGKTEEEYLKDMRECEEFASKQMILGANELSDQARHNHMVGQCLKEKGYTP